ncbi:hypothetical protein [Streptomyces sp. NPDC021096]
MAEQVARVPEKSGNPAHRRNSPGGRMNVSILEFRNPFISFIAL